MIIPRSFSSGGIQTEENKRETLLKPSRNSVLPATARVPLLQHSGDEAELCVQKGDIVRDGDIIGKSRGGFSSNIHAPIPGVVSEVEEIALPDGRLSTVVSIQLSGEFRWIGKQPERHDWEHLTRDQLMAEIAAKGVVGIGGFGIPSHEKLRVSKGKKTELVIINGCESEPYNTSDFRMMAEHPEAVVEGIRIIERLLSPRQIILSLPEGYMRKLQELKKILKREKTSCKIVIFSSKYPQGEETLLIQSFSGSFFTSTQNAKEEGYLVVNVSTTAAIFDAVVHKRPMIDRIITVAGSAVKEPKNIKAPIGTPLAMLLHECGGVTDSLQAIVIDSPFYGNKIEDLSLPVTKSMKSLLCLSAKEVANHVERECIKCGKCVTVCPRDLNPILIYKHLKSGDMESAIDLGLDICNGCGCCSYICPSRISLVEEFKSRKKGI